MVWCSTALQQCWEPGDLQLLSQHRALLNSSAHLTQTQKRHADIIPHWKGHSTDCSLSEKRTSPTAQPHYRELWSQLHSQPGAVQLLDIGIHHSPRIWRSEIFLNWTQKTVHCFGVRFWFWDSEAESQMTWWKGKIQALIICEPVTGAADAMRMKSPAEDVLKRMSSTGKAEYSIHWGQRSK